jgi:hypothetical protein
MPVVPRCFLPLQECLRVVVFGCKDTKKYLKQKGKYMKHFPEGLLHKENGKVQLLTRVNKIFSTFASEIDY